MSALLDATADVLSRRGWHQGSAVSPDGRVCVLQALGLAARTLPLASPYDAVNDAIQLLTRHLGRSPVAFNDDPSTSYEDVLLALKQAR